MSGATSYPTQRALAAWAGTHRLSALDHAALLAKPITRASAALALFVAGADVPAALVARELMRHGARAGDDYRAHVAILPTARGVIACDRGDAPDARDRVCWPDDSSYHLARAIPPGRRARWVDLGCGSAFAAMERPELASQIVGVDVNERAIGFARLGAELSGIAHFEAVVADAAAWAGEPFDLVTCNPPIPDGAGPIWRGMPAGAVHAMLARARSLVAPGGMLVAHGALDALAPIAAGGDATLVAYTPPGAAVAFAVLWWQPGPPRTLAARRALSPDRPHIDHADLEAARAGTLPPL